MALSIAYSIYRSVCHSSLLLGKSIILFLICHSIYHSVALLLYCSIALSTALSIFLFFCLLCLLLCLSFYISLSKALPLFLSVSLSIILCLSLHLFFCLSIFLLLYLITCLSIALSLCLSFYILLNCSIAQSFCHSIIPSIYCYVNLPFCLLLCLSISTHLSVQKTSESWWNPSKMQLFYKYILVYWFLQQCFNQRSLCRETWDVVWSFIWRKFHSDHRIDIDREDLSCVLKSKRLMQSKRPTWRSRFIVVSLGRSLDGLFSTLDAKETAHRAVFPCCTVARALLTSLAPCSYKAIFRPHRNLLLREACWKGGSALMTRKHDIYCIKNTLPQISRDLVMIYSGTFEFRSCWIGMWKIILSSC